MRATIPCPHCDGKGGWSDTSDGRQFWLPCDECQGEGEVEPEEDQEDD